MNVFSKNVFINCPFDSDYYPLLRPLIYTLLCNGFNPRIAIENSDSGQLRADKLVELIKDSKYSIHDLSRLQASEKDEIFRLNMPFELGIDYGARRFSKRLSEKKFLILEKERYKYMQALSDINGFDIKAHNNSTYGVIKAVRDWLVETAKLKKVDSPTKIWDDFNECYGSIYDEKIEDKFTADEINFMPIPELIDEIMERLPHN